MLIVEEEDNLRALVRELLAKRGFKVLDAPDGDEALRLCRESPDGVHLLITDLVLALMSGIILAKKAMAMHPKMKTIFLEDHSESTMISMGIPLSSLEYLPKPIKMKALIAKVEELLGVTPSEPR